MCRSSAAPSERRGGCIARDLANMVPDARVDTAISGANEPLSRTERSGTFKVATYNVWSGQNGGLESALRAMDACGVDLGLFQETKLTKGIYTRNLSGYRL